MKREAGEVLELWRELEDAYSQRNSVLAECERFFGGDHWSSDADEDGVVDQVDDDTSFRLIFNYTRAIVLKYAAILAKAPRVRIPVITTDLEIKRRASVREKFLIGIWPQFMRAWRDAEMNASKKKFGVVQVLWDPEPDQPQTVEVGKGEDKSSTKRYTESPLRFRSIPPERFYPCYRTYDAPDDFLYVIEYDPRRLVEDLEEIYKEKLQATELQAGTEGTVDLIKYWDKDDYQLIAYTKYVKGVDRQGKPVEEEQVVVLDEFGHKYKRAPFWVLQNLRNPDQDPVDGGSLGDIDAVAALNKHYNLMNSEAAEEIAINIHRPVQYKSDDHMQDPNKLEFKPGAVYPIGLEEELEPLKWDGMPQSVENHLNRILAGIQDLSFMGRAGFGDYPEGASGVGLRLVMASLEQIIQLKVPLRVDLIQSVCKFLFRIIEEKTQRENQGAPLVLWLQDKLGRFGQVQIDASQIQRDYFVDIDYSNLLPRNDAEYEQNEVYKWKTGVQSLWSTMDNLGIEDPDTEIERLKRELEDPVLNPEKVKAQLELKALEQSQQQQQAQPQPMGTGNQVPSRPLPGAAQPGTRPVTGAPPQPSMNMAPPVPGTPTPGPGNLAPFMSRSTGPNVDQLRKLMSGAPGMPQPG